MNKSRREKMQAQLAAAGLAGALISDLANVRYLSGYTNGEAWLLLDREQALLLTDFRYQEQAERECPDLELRLLEKGDLASLAAQCVSEAGWSRLGFEADALTYGEFCRLQTALTGVELVALTQGPELLREIKDSHEIACLEQAAAATDRVFERLCGYLKPGLSERQVRWQLLTFIEEAGCGSSFDPIVVSGANGSLPHGVAGDKLLVPGELVTMDFGCEYQGYKADMTRTVALGLPDDKMKEIYQIVLKAHLLGLEAIAPGVSCRAVDGAARDYISNYGYGSNFGHGTGHGVGLDIHEAPRVNSRNDQLLRPGQVITVEPGIYLPGVGGVRIEDTVLVIETGHRSLFTAPKELICL